MDDYMGMIRMFAGSYAPRGFMSCNGQQLSISTNSALYSLIGTVYGGNGQSTFGLPNLAGRTMIGTGNSAFGSYAIGEVAGNTQITLLNPNMPAHTHVATFAGTSVTIPAPTMMASSAAGTAATPSSSANTLAQMVVPRTANIALYNNSTPDTNLNIGPSTGSSITPTGNVTVGIAGGSQPVNISNPYMALTALIVVEGLYPSRN
jgi:microcystin-dependent protein